LSVLAARDEPRHGLIEKSEQQRLVSDAAVANLE
jgi:hypothetical protein